MPGDVDDTLFFVFETAPKLSKTRSLMDLVADKAQRRHGESMVPTDEKSYRSTIPEPTPHDMHP